MLEIARRTLLQAPLLAGSTRVSELIPAIDQDQRALARTLEAGLEVPGETAWLLAQRLNWGGRWPIVAVSGATLVTVASSLDLQQLRNCTSTVPKGALLAIYAGRPAERSRWHSLPETRVEMLGWRMTAFRSGWHQACLVEPSRHGATGEIALRIL